MSKTSVYTRINDKGETEELRLTVPWNTVNNIPLPPTIAFRNPNDIKKPFIFTYQYTEIPKVELVFETTDNLIAIITEAR